MDNSNTITINGYVRSIVPDMGEFLLSMPNVTQSLHVKAENGLLDAVRSHIGKRISVTGKLASEDVVLLHPCDCHTVSKGIESYIIADSISDGCFINEARVAGIITDDPKLVTTTETSFYTCRLRLRDNNGYVTVSTPSLPGTKGDTIEVNGKLRWKDYNRKVNCKTCGKVFEKPTLTLLVKGI